MRRLWWQHARARARRSANNNHSLSRRSAAARSSTRTPSAGSASWERDASSRGASIGSSPLGSLSPDATQLEAVLGRCQRARGRWARSARSGRRGERARPPRARADEREGVGRWGWRRPRPLSFPLLLSMSSPPRCLG